MSGVVRPLRLAVLIKQVPVADEMRLGPDGRIERRGTHLEMSAYCRRAVSKAVELAAAVGGSTVTVVTVGPPSAQAALREAVAWGLDRDVDIRGILLTDAALAGSDTYATARALAALLQGEGPFDLILTGKNSIDADTGQVPPQLAELLDLPFACGVKQLEHDGDVLRLGCEHDDSWVDLTVRLPAVVSCAERLCDPAKVPAASRADVPGRLIATRNATALGPGPWGAAGSLTRVGACRATVVTRLGLRRGDEPLAKQVEDAVQVLVARGALEEGRSRTAAALPMTGGGGAVVAVVAEPEQELVTRELGALSARLASALGGSTILLAAHDITAADAGSWGFDQLVTVDGAEAGEDVARAISGWAAANPPWAILCGSTAYGREIASRVAVAIGAGLTGDAVELEVVEGRLVAWKPAFGGQLVAAITATSSHQMVTIRAGVVPVAAPRAAVATRSSIRATPRHRVVERARRQEDVLTRLAEADVVIGIGRGVGPDEIEQLDELRELLGAEIGCTRKLTDDGWMPHARQVGITGRSISPRLYLAVGTSGKFNHMAGVLSAGTVLAINPDPDAPVFAHADVGVVATFQECVPLLVWELRRAGVKPGQLHAQAVEELGTTR